METEIQTLRAELARAKEENEQLRQNCITYEAFQLLTNDLKQKITQLEAERDQLKEQLARRDAEDL